MAIVGRRSPRLTAAIFEGPGHVDAKPVAHFTGRDEAMAALEASLTNADIEAVCVVAEGLERRSV